MEPPFVGPSYNLDSRPASVQRTVNLIPVPQEPGNERTTWVFKDVPGLVLLTDFVPVGADNWLVFDGAGGTLGPTNQVGSGYADIAGALVPFAFGTTISRDSGLGAAGPASMVVPLKGPATAPAIVEELNWFPTTLAGSVTPVLSQDDPSPGGIWTAAGANWFLRLGGSALGEFTGGILKLAGAGVNVTLITFGNYYLNPTYGQTVTVEYADSTPPSPPASQAVSLPFTGTVEVASASGHWYTFTLAATTAMRIDTVGTPFDTMLGLFDSAGNLIQSDDDGGGGAGTSLITRTLTAGQYYVFVSGYSARYAAGWNITFPNGSTAVGTATVFIGEAP